MRTETFTVAVFHPKYYTSFNVAKKTSHFDSGEKNIITALRYGNMFCVKFQVFLKSAMFFGISCLADEDKSKFSCNTV